MSTRTKRPRRPGAKTPNIGVRPESSGAPQSNGGRRAADGRARRNAPGRRAPNGRFDPPPHRPRGGAALPRPQAPRTQAVAQSVSTALPRRIGQIDEPFLSDILPSLNGATQGGEIGVAEFAEVVSSRMTEEDLVAAAQSGRQKAAGEVLFDLAALGAIASSIVFHERRASRDKNSSAGIALVPGLEAALLAFGEMLGRAPRDNHDTTWGAGFAISFTGTKGEARFGRAVRAANRLLGSSAVLVMPLRTGELSLAEGVTRLEEAHANVRANNDVQADLVANAFSGDFLAMRNYLARYVVGGLEREPPNATYTSGWTGFELGLGLLEGFRLSLPGG